LGGNNIDVGDVHHPLRDVLPNVVNIDGNSDNSKHVVQLNNAVACRQHLNFLRRFISVNINSAASSRWTAGLPQGQLSLVVQSTVESLFDILLSRADSDCRQMTPRSLAAARSVTDAAAETIVKLTTTATDSLTNPDSWVSNRGIRQLIDYVASSSRTSNAVSGLLQLAMNRNCSTFASKN
jgi:hypothetical protein